METIKIVLYLLAVVTCFACTMLLFRAYLKRRETLLLWCSICFVGLTVNNLFLFIDLVMLPTIDLRMMRFISALGGTLFLLYGFIWETD